MIKEMTTILDKFSCKDPPLCSKSNRSYHSKFNINSGIESINNQIKEYNSGKRLLLDANIIRSIIASISINSNTNLIILANIQ